MEDEREMWEKGLLNEVSFWDGIILGTDPHKEWVDGFLQLAKGDNEFPSHLRKYLPKEDVANVRILDVGAGPHTVLGPKLQGATLAITAIDPLAEPFAQAIRKANVQVSIPTISGEAEALSKQFGAVFDLVYSRNAIAHSYNAPHSLAQMLKVCKPGGYVYIEGASNEAIKRGPMGLNQWNLMPVDGDLVVWRMDFHRSMRAYLSKYQVFEVKGDVWYQMAIQKSHD